MRALLTLVIFNIVQIIYGQQIQSIQVVAQQADEPPTVSGRPEYKMVFKRVRDGSLQATTYSIWEEKKKLTPININKDRVLEVEKWLSHGKNEFNIEEIEPNITRGALVSNPRLPHHNLTFEIPKSIIIKPDSFTFCQKHKMEFAITNGGEKTEVTICTGRDTLNYYFETRDWGANEFDLNGYLLCYKLLKGLIPKDFPSDKFFTPDELNDIVLVYLKGIECEGYYYNEFRLQNQQRTSLEHRMKVGWDFKEYLRKRQKQ